MAIYYLARPAFWVEANSVPFITKMKTENLSDPHSFFSGLSFLLECCTDP